MHEWALADGVVSTVIKVAREEKLKKIIKIKIKIGELQQIDLEIFRHALQDVIRPQKSMLRHAEIEMDIEAAILKCRNCGHEWSFDKAMSRLNEDEAESIHFIPEIAHVYITCPSCKSPDFQVIQGRGVWIDSIEGE